MVKPNSAVDESEAIHRSAVTYLRMTGKEAYTAEKYIAACELIRSGEVVTRSANNPPAGPLGAIPI
jgi:hypothetical protein